MALEWKPPELHEQLRRLYHENGTDVPIPGDPYRIEWEAKKLEEAERQKAFTWEFGTFVNGCYDPRPVPAVKKEEKKMSDIPKNVHLAPEKRIGDPARDEIISRLQEAYGNGELPEPELDVRVNLAMKAVTRKDLDVLTRDLEPIQKTLNTGMPAVITHPKQKKSYAFLAPATAALLSLANAFFANPNTAIGEWQVIASVFAMTFSIITALWLFRGRSS